LLTIAACASNTGPDAVVKKIEPGLPTPGSGSNSDSGGPAEGPGGGAEDPLGPDEPEDFAELGSWSPCEGSFECTTLTVPRDWSDVDGDTLDIAVIRKPAQGDRIGSLVFNPGGPGGSGVDFLSSFVESGSVPSGLDERFDLVAWDPRGTGDSSRIDCTEDDEWLEPDIDPTLEDDADVDALRTEVTGALEACTEQFGDLLELVGTRATVRDLDALRGALGDEKLTYVGYSYGTTIGLEYLRLYADRVRAMVLDGVSVPGVDPVTDTHVQAQGFERTLDAYLADCAERPTCPLGDDDPKAVLLSIADLLEGERLPASYSLQAPGAVTRNGTVGIGELYIAVAASLYRKDDWGLLDEALGEVLGNPATGVTLLALRDQYLGRQADGSWEDDIDSRSAIRCADQAERAVEPEGDPSLVEPWSAELPFWGAWFATGTPGCYGLPDAIEPLQPLEAGAIDDAPPVVVIGTTNDPATPYEQSVDAQRIVTGSSLVTYEGEEHTAYKSISVCVDDAVTTYLIELTPPPADLRCTD
jgi:pimeloyl-ACP methyl ester carboxylesterase